MTANAVKSREQFSKDLENGLTILVNLTEKENINSETYTYYKCELIKPNSFLRRTIIVAVYEN